MKEININVNKQAKRKVKILAKMLICLIMIYNYICSLSAGNTQKELLHVTTIM